MEHDTAFESNEAEGDHLPQIGGAKKGITKFVEDVDVDSDDEFGLKDDNDLNQIQINVGAENNDDEQKVIDDDDFFGSDDEPTGNSAPLPQQQSQQVVPLPKLGVEKLSSEMSDFKKSMLLTIEQQKKKNQIGEQIIAERVDESDDDENGNRKATTAAPTTGYRSRLSKITRLADESTHAHK